ncbi:D-ribulokinase YDR109C [Diutina catenulata]
MSRTNLTTRKSSFFNAPAQPPMADVYYAGVDVGTGSARCCIIDTNGIILALAEKPISRHELKPNFITQSSTEIWNAICYCTKSAIRDSGVDPEHVYGIGFDATCSLVAINEKTDAPAAVGPDFSDEKENIILWMDHRAEDETNAINATGDPCLKYVGGQMSIEMELPKMKWLKHHRPGGVDDLKFYDLADYLTHRATGDEARSYCSTVCKQGFLPLGVEGSKTGWSKEFLEQVEMPELVANDFQKLGGTPESGRWLSAGEAVANLSADAAAELGLTTECTVGSGVIDAYAGWIGTVAAQVDVPDKWRKQEGPDATIAAACGRLAAVAGTSTCHIAMTKEACFVKGVWGPYRDVMVPGYWLAEGGQSMTGALLAHVLAIHPAARELAHEAEQSNLSKFDYLNSRLEDMVQKKGERSVVSLAKHWFFYGDFHGNRSPIADPRMRAAIIGQSMDTSVDDLAVQYFAACEFIAQQTRQIIEEMEDSGHNISYVFMSGGQCRNGLLMRLLADCTGKPVIIPRYIDAAVVFGSALLGAVSSEKAVAEHIRTGGRSRRSSKLAQSRSQVSLGQAQGIERPPSPYTQPSASASTANMAALAYSHAPQHPSATNLASGGLHAMTPMKEEDEKPKPRSSAVESDSEDEGTLSFGSKSNVQQGVNQKLKDLSMQEAEATRAGEELWKVMRRMTGPGRVIVPNDPNIPERQLLNAKYKVFLEQCTSQQRYRDMVDETLAKATGAAK